MKSYRQYKPSLRMLAILEPIAPHLKDACPWCERPVVLYFDHAGPRKRYFPSHEKCEKCGWTRTVARLKREHGIA